MRMLRSASLLLVLLTLAACKEGDVDGFDGSVFPEDDAGGKQTDAAIDDEDSGASSDAAVSDAGTDASVPTLAEAGSVISKAACAGLLACTGEALLNEFLFGEDCVSGRTTRLEESDFFDLESSVKAGRLEFHADAMAACAKDIAALGCDVQTRRIVELCEDALSGTVPLDGDCAIDIECVGNAMCDRGNPSACPGKCVARLEVGATCAGTRECEDGLVCSNKVCTALGGNGDSCESGDPKCGVGFTCHTETSGKVCRSIESVYSGKLADACTVGSMLCETDLVCESTMNTMGICAERVGKGGACKRAQPEQCSKDEYCDAVNPGESGNCVPFPEEGDPCLVGSGGNLRNQPCAGGYTCHAGSCTKLRNLGDLCSVSAQCFSGTCTGDACAPPPACDP